MEYQPTVEENLNRLMRVFLVHSFLYYKLDESIMSDHKFDKLCVDLDRLIQENQEIAMSMEYYELCKDVGTTGSGSHILDYPLSIINAALRVLWWNRKKNNVEFNESFEMFVGRWGYRLAK